MFFSFIASINVYAETYEYDSLDRVVKVTYDDGSYESQYIDIWFSSRRVSQTPKFIEMKGEVGNNGWVYLSWESHSQDELYNLYKDGELLKVKTKETKYLDYDTEANKTYTYYVEALQAETVRSCSIVF